MSEYTVEIAWVDRHGYARTAEIDYRNMQEEVRLLEELGYKWTVAGPVTRKFDSTDEIKLKVKEEGVTDDQG